MGKRQRGARGSGLRFPISPIELPHAGQPQPVEVYLCTGAGNPAGACIRKDRRLDSLTLNCISNLNVHFIGLGELPQRHDEGVD